jgi:hypothetical protein
MSHTQPHLLLVIEVRTNLEHLFRMAVTLFLHCLLSTIYHHKVFQITSGLGSYNNDDFSINVHPTGKGGGGGHLNFSTGFMKNNK